MKIIMEIEKDICTVDLKLSKKEIEAIKLRDIEDLKPKLCAKKMNLKIDEFENILNNARYKIAKEIYYNNCIKIVIEEEIQEDELYFTFRCAVCGTIYKINGYEDKIACPLCLSNKVMSAKEAGFYKKSY